MASENPFKGNLTSLLKPGGGEFGKFYSLPSLKDPRADKLPYSIRILLESAILEIPFKPAWVLLQDFTGVPAVVDLACMCDALNKLGSDSNKINPLVSPGSLLQAPLDDDASRGTVTKHLCDTQRCPIDLITPPDDCHVNYTLSFSLQICRVEDLVNGIMKGSIVHIHRVRTVIVGTDGVLTTLELGCTEGIGKENFLNGAGGGAGHGGRGGSGYFNGRVSIGGDEYGNAIFPCRGGMIGK
ncbi:hypothetical protein AHAS_Ahas17G0169700 [Arachis hypogaea]